MLVHIVRPTLNELRLLVDSSEHDISFHGRDEIRICDGVPVVFCSTEKRRAVVKAFHALQGRCLDVAQSVLIPCSLPEEAQVDADIVNELFMHLSKHHVIIFVEVHQVTMVRGHILEQGIEYWLYKLWHKSLRIDTSASSIIGSTRKVEIEVIGDENEEERGNEEEGGEAWEEKEGEAWERGEAWDEKERRYEMGEESEGKLRDQRGEGMKNRGNDEDKCWEAKCEDELGDEFEVEWQAESEDGWEEEWKDELDGEWEDKWGKGGRKGGQEYRR